MTDPRQPRLTRLGATALRAHFDTGEVAFDENALPGPQDQPGQLPAIDALVFAALAGPDRLASLRQVSVKHLLEDLPRRDVRLVEEAPVAWDPIVQLAVAVKSEASPATLQRLSTVMEMGSATNSALSLGVSVFEQLAAETGQPASRLLAGLVQ